MTVVVDLGCAVQQGEESLVALTERFHPDTVYGFDPLLSADRYSLNGSAVIVSSLAAWIADGTVRMSRGNHIDATALPQSARWNERTAREVPCFDFSRWLERHGPAIVKMDIEGAEFPVLERMIQAGTDRLVELLLIEWHDRFFVGYESRPAELTATLACPVELWH